MSCKTFISVRRHDSKLIVNTRIIAVQNANISPQSMLQVLHFVLMIYTYMYVCMYVCVYIYIYIYIYIYTKV